MNPKIALGILTMAAPIVILGSICSIATVFYNLQEVPVTKTTGSEVTTLCTSKKYVQLLNGVCDRGVVNGIDVEASCLQWTDPADWKQLDETNAVNSLKKPGQCVPTDTEAEAAAVWAPLSTLNVITIPMALISFIVCVVTADVDMELWNIDFDKAALIISAVANAFIVCIFASTLLVTYNSEVLNKKTWQTPSCTYSTAPSFAYFLIVLGGFFALMSFGVAVQVYIRAYIFPLPEDETGLLKANFSAVSPSPDGEGDGDDDSDDGKPGPQGATGPPPSTPPLRSHAPHAVAPDDKGSDHSSDANNSQRSLPQNQIRPVSASSVAPAPEKTGPSSFTGIMLG